MAAAGKNILMYPILEKRLLAEGIWLMQVLAPRVAHSAPPGQFVIVRVDEHGERIPLTISDYDPAQGSVTTVSYTHLPEARVQGAAAGSPRTAGEVCRRPVAVARILRTKKREARLPAGFSIRRG